MEMNPHFSVHGDIIVGVKPDGHRWRGWAMPRPGHLFVTLKSGARVREFLTPGTFGTWWAARAAVLDFVDE